MKTLQEWLAWADTLDAMYLRELGRSVFSDRQAFVNWTWHRAQGRDEAWVLAQIRNSTEWRVRHSPAPSIIGEPGAITPIAGGWRVLKVADASEGPFHPRFYSYWSNAWINDRIGAAFVFAGNVDGQARFWRVNLATGAVQRLGPLVERRSTTEGWSWDAEGKILLCDGPRLYRVDPFTRAETVVFDISETHPGCRLWQSHSEGATHCATVERITESGPYDRIGTVVYRHGQQRFFSAGLRLDESMISGDWLIIKEERERDGRLRLDNRIIGLDEGLDYWINDEGGALGHSDGEHGIVVGENDNIGACVRWDMSNGAKATRLFDTWNLGHVSLRGERCIVSNTKAIGLVDLNGVAGVTVLVEHGGEGTDYDSQVRANLDPTGRVACYMANGSVYLLKVTP